MTPYEYAVLRFIPDLERGECLNVGVVVYCQKHDYLGVRFTDDEARMRAFAPAAALTEVRRALAGIAAHCAGDDHAAAESLGRRFRWLTAPRSTIVQPGPVHPGMTGDPDGTLDHLFERLVRA
ncbi:DUF3037 domain-containing protein [Actinocorallia sp. API 0066]|uniref:DUF3037 domain-containing protein n=1 Tax=Actinocorallia sp. API 0066 TaxID=2896846 RepID=UPI001E4FD6BF|nr:DUF3037 domain-containing protein [Actinocorallia sp. API 0066]MCD0448477.1 DUF3037 domain-containing protein [Actinocorallia sp. API 0066]